MKSTSYKSRCVYILITVLLFLGTLKFLFQWKIDSDFKALCQPGRLSNDNLLRAEKLLSMGANPNQNVGSSSFPLIFEFMGSFQVYNDSNHNKLFICMLNHGLNPNSSDGWDESEPLLSMGYSIEIERQLIAHGGLIYNNMETAEQTIKEVVARGNNEEIDLFKKTYRDQLHHEYK